MENVRCWGDGILHYTDNSQLMYCGNKQNTVQQRCGLHLLSSQYIAIFITAYIYMHIHTASLSKIFYWGCFSEHCKTSSQDTAINIFFSIWRWLKRVEICRVSWILTTQQYTSLQTCIRCVTDDGWVTLKQVEERWIKKAASCSDSTFERLTATTQAYQQPSHLKSNLRFNYQGKSHCSAISQPHSKLGIWMETRFGEEENFKHS